MKTLSKKEAVEAINDFGSRRIPFLFIIDFLMKTPIDLPFHRRCCFLFVIFES
jgi:hypothetical protein